MHCMIWHFGHGLDLEVKSLLQNNNRAENGKGNEDFSWDSNAAFCFYRPIPMLKTTMTK